MVVVADDVDLLVVRPRLGQLERAVSDRHLAERDLLALVVDPALDVLLGTEANPDARRRNPSPQTASKA